MGVPAVAAALNAAVAAPVAVLAAVAAAADAWVPLLSGPTVTKQMRTQLHTKCTFIPHAQYTWL